MATRRYPATADEFYADVKKAEAKFGPLVMRLSPAELAGLSNVASLALEQVNAELKAEAKRAMQERAPKIGAQIGREGGHK